MQTTAGLINNQSFFCFICSGSWKEVPANEKEGVSHMRMMMMMVVVVRMMMMIMVSNMRMMMMGLMTR